MNRTAVFVICILGIAATALALRLPRLNLRPMHADEAVHAIKFDTLWHTGRYEYDPQDYHGPTLYYFALPSVWLCRAADLADTDAATFRIVPVVFGVGLILLLLLVADGVGRSATVLAGVLTALSPALTYYSRYYIQETLLVFFTFLAIATSWRYVHTRRAGWALLTGASLGLMLATKETSVIALAGMAVAAAGAALWSRRGNAAAPRAPRFRPAIIAAAIVTAVAVSFLLLSGFLSNCGGIIDALRAVTTYSTRAGSAQLHEHPWYYYLQILTFWRAGAGPIWSEGLVVALSLVGLYAALRGQVPTGVSAPLTRFLALYTVLMIVIYSAIPYKTPWCILSFLHGMILLAGVGAVVLLHAARLRAGRVALAAVLLVAAAHLGWQAQRANSDTFCNSERNPYVYAQTLRDTVELTRQLDDLAQVHRDGHHLLIHVIVENCWPLPWYLRGFTRVGYWETVPEAPDADVVLATSKLGADLDSRLKDTYEISHRGLRRDERLLVYVRKDLWDALLTHLRSSAGASTRPTQE